MIDRGKKNLLGVRLDTVDYETTVERVIAAARSRQGLLVSALAVHGVMIGALDPVQRYRLNHFDLLVPDGQPVRWALNWLHGAKLQERVYGPALMLQICEQAARENLPIYLYGSRPPVLEALTRELSARFPGLDVAGAQPSRFRRISGEEKRSLVEQIQASGAAIVFVGLGCPRQEVWAYEVGPALSRPVVAVGAAFDFHAGTLAQAPESLQGAGMEWFFRLVQEPTRLWKRYLLLNPLYLALLTLQKLGLARFDPAKATPPDGEMRYG